MAGGGPFVAFVGFGVKNGGPNGKAEKRGCFITDSLSLSIAVRRKKPEGQGINSPTPLLYLLCWSKNCIRGKKEIAFFCANTCEGERQADNVGGLGRS